MKKLNHSQLAALYVICFNISESGLTNVGSLIQPINELLAFNYEPSYDDFIPDEDGAPINSTQPTYDAYQELFCSSEDPDLSFVNDYLSEDEPTLDLLLSILEQFKD